MSSLHNIDEIEEPQVRQLRESAKRQNGKSAVCLSVFLFCTAVCLVSMALKLGPALLMSILFFVFSALSIYVLSASFLTGYEYVLYIADEGSFFEVVKVQGKRRMTQVAVEVVSIRSILRKNVGEKVKRPEGAYYSFCISTVPERCQYLSILGQDRTFCARVEMSDALADALWNEVLTAKAREAEEEPDSTDDNGNNGE